MLSHLWNTKHERLTFDTSLQSFHFSLSAKVVPLAPFNTLSAEFVPVFTNYLQATHISIDHSGICVKPFLMSSHTSQMACETTLGMIWYKRVVKAEIHGAGSARYSIFQDAINEDKGCRPFLLYSLIGINILWC